MQPVGDKVTGQDFGRISFQTVEQNGKRCLAVINAARASNLFLRFEENGEIAYAHLEKTPLKGGGITLFNGKSHIKADSISDEELGKLHIQVGKVNRVIVRQYAYAKEPFYEAVIDVDVLIKGQRSSFAYLMPFVPKSFSLDHKKVVVLTNVKRECIDDPEIHILCGKDCDGNWEPFVLTNDAITYGTRAKF